VVAKSVDLSASSPAITSVFAEITARRARREARKSAPRIADTPSQQPDRVVNTEFPSGKKKSLAIVENEQDLISIYSRVIKELGFDPIIVAREGEEIVRAVAEGRVSPDVVIMDYRLPGINGIEAAKKILEHRPATKVIVASADDSVRDESLSLGFTFLQKPFSLATFSDRIRRVVSQLP
jgi:two-component system chemotaxis response regulator CheY